MKPGLLHRLLASTNNEVKKALNLGYHPVILTTPLLRRHTTPPALRLAQTSYTVVLPTPSATGATVDVLAASGAHAIDAVDASVTLTHNGPASFPEGTTAATITATDDAGNASQKQFTVNVVFNFGGFLPPVNPNGSSIFRAGRAIPVKFQLFAANGGAVASATATLQVFKASDAVLGTVEEITPDAAGSSNTGNLFRYDSLSQQYIYDFKTTGYTRGTKYFAFYIEK